VVQRYTTIMLLHSGAQRVAVHVDELIGNREIVVKNIGPQLARVPGVAGATVLGNGKVVLILNPVQLAQRQGIPSLLAQRQSAVQQLPAALPVIMIVDDSLTVRKITSKLLTREGYQVVTAKDGVDALQALEDVTPQVMLVDIEMPRMDGFELTKNVRGNAKTANIPIIMITSRTAEKHRNYAQELGVNVYLGKPYQEEELLGYIAGFVKGNLH
jgi:chemosensory pili system protein ChpA (sensor histidine kinase/response regulator)